MDPGGQPTSGESTRRLAMADREWVIRVLETQATEAPGLAPQQYIRDLLRRAHWPSRWVARWSGVWTGNAPVDVRALVEWAERRGQNPEEQSSTTIGSLLAPLLEDLGLTDQERLTEILVGHCLCHDQPASSIMATITRWAELCQRDPGELAAQAADPGQVEQVIAAYCQALVDPLAPLVGQFVDQVGTVSSVTTARAPGAGFGFDFSALIYRQQHDLACWQGGGVPPDLAGDYAGASREPAPREPVPNVRARLLSVQRGVLLGEPGSGKTWTLLRLLAEYAGRWLEGHESGRTTHRPLIPFLVAYQSVVRSCVRKTMSHSGARLVPPARAPLRGAGGRARFAHRLALPGDGQRRSLPNAASAGSSRGRCPDRGQPDVAPDGGLRAFNRLNSIDRALCDNLAT